MASIIEKAHSLADAIVASEEYQMLRKAEQDMMNDDMAQEVINEYNEVQRRVYEGEKTDELQEKIEYMQREMENTPAITAYLEAQDKVTKILEEVNFILGKAINGEQEEDGCDTDSCGGGCCGCS